ncbi:CheR family methyltransferase [Chitinispirillales bacterium ANBcel5]|uniref:CheR family methyltransferase n=1 Tax=Cellulosispirillum alkaliphilum TaxID=3039283 RepID=UPI002A5415E4|nr:CheR family methyltransferase [Chitinispirillales bacterium ANBcel5]
MGSVSLDCTSFLQWCLPKLEMRYEGFRKVRKRPCKKLRRRAQYLGLKSLNEYQKYLEENHQEWESVDQALRIFITRFYRDKGTFDYIARFVLPSLRLNQTLRVLSLGCAAGQEPYTVAMLLDTCCPKNNGADTAIIATDSDSGQLERAKKGQFYQSEIKELPPELKASYFQKEIKPQTYTLSETIKKRVTFMNQDVRKELPEGHFHLILCRNLVFTYFSEDLQITIGSKIVSKLTPGGYLILGSHERVPEKVQNLALYERSHNINRRVANG